MSARAVLNHEVELTELQHRRSLVRVGKILQRSGFVAGTDGNLSIRLDESRVMITPTKISKGMMAADDMVIVDMEGRYFSGRRAPSSEIGVHLTIYKARSDIHAVVHAHPCTATAFACAGMALDEPLCSEILMTLGRVPIAPYRAPGTPELSQVLAPFVMEHDAILMANHGVLAYGQDLATAHMNMEIVEHFAKLVLLARQLGRGNLLHPDSVRELAVIRTKYRLGSNSPLISAYEEAHKP